MFKGRNLSASSPCSARVSRRVCGAVLFISKFQDDYAGLYNCRSSLPGEEIQVTLGVQPNFIARHQTDYLAKVGQSLDMDCSVEANVYPPALVEWEKQVGEILRKVGTGEKLTIKKVGLNDSGTYICKATNMQDKPFATRLKHVALYVYVPASCKFVSATTVASDIFVKTCRNYKIPGFQSICSTALR
jgi:hypothetical protein